MIPGDLVHAASILAERRGIASLEPGALRERVLKTAAPPRRRMPDKRRRGRESDEAAELSAVVPVLVRSAGRSRTAPRGA